MNAPRHFLALDGVRGSAVLMIVLHHYLQSVPPGRLVNWLERAGFGTGVDLFFVLSGFLITGILLRSKHSDRFLFNFYMRRVLRIFPLYFAFLILFFSFLNRVTPDPVSEQNVWTYWLFLQNIGITFWGTRGGPIHFWSLAVEEHFYLFWPLVVGHLGPRWLLRVLWCVIAFAILTRAVLTVAGFDAQFFTPARFDSLAAGAIVAILAERGTLTRALRPTLRAIAVGAPLLAALVLVGSRASIAVQVLKWPLITFLYTGIVAAAISLPPGAMLIRFLSSRFLCVTGRYSYGMYVMHVAVIRLIHLIVPSSFLVGLALSVAATYLAAWVSWHCIEKHFLKLKDRFAYTQTAFSNAA